MKRLFHNPNPGARDYLSLAAFGLIYGLGLLLAAAPVLFLRLFG